MRFVGFQVTVCGSLLITKFFPMKPSAKWAFAAAVALTPHEPIPVKVITPVVESTVHPVVPGETTEYVMAPPPTTVAASGLGV